MSKRYRWYAQYLNPSDFLILDERQRRELIKTELESSNRERAFQLLKLNCYPTLAKAKAYLRMHLRGDRDECIQSLKALKRIK